MPLKPGFGKKTFGHNVSKLVKEGRKPNQAVAIAYKEREKSKRDVASMIQAIKKSRFPFMKTKKK